MNLSAYQRLVIGYHGCDESVAKKVIGGQEHLIASEESYDWLGKGIYFWEHGPDRALEWAKERQHAGRIKKPAVVGALIQLGTCFDLLDTEFTSILPTAFETMKKALKGEIPRNTGGVDLLKRELDCFFLNWLFGMVRGPRGNEYQTVRGLFQEGGAAFEGSGIRLKSHIQIAVRDPACIVGYFRPFSDREV